MNLNQVKNYTKGVLQGWFLNKPALDKISESEDGKILYNNSPIQDSYSKEEFDEILKSDYKQIFDKDSNIELLDAPVSFTSDAASTLGTGKITNVNQSFSLSQSIENFDYLIFDIGNFQPDYGYAESYQSIVFSVKDIVYNPTETGNDYNSSSKSFNVNLGTTTSNAFGEYTITLLFWFKNETEIFVCALINPMKTKVGITINSIIGTKFNSTEIYKETNVLSTPTNYSLEEYCIGSWVNGKPIYRKVIHIDSLHSSGEAMYETGIDNIDAPLKCYGYTYNQDYTNVFTLPYTDTKYGITTYIYQGELYIGVCTDRTSQKAYIVLEYTKTTDEENSFTLDMLSTDEIDDTITDEDIENLMTQIKEG